MNVTTPLWISPPLGFPKILWVFKIHPGFWKFYKTHGAISKPRNGFCKISLDFFWKTQYTGTSVCRICSNREKHHFFGQKVKHLTTDVLFSSQKSDQKTFFFCVLCVVVYWFVFEKNNLFEALSKTKNKKRKFLKGRNLWGNLLIMHPVNTSNAIFSRLPTKLKMQNL